MLAGGCETARFYGQAIVGHCRLMVSRRAIPVLVERANTPPELRTGLVRVLALREFARTNLGLPVGSQYVDYVALGRSYVAWNVSAAPEFSMNARSWWYPMIGAQDYRGYFNEADARRFAQRLERQGYDVAVGGVEAYSTLGWFPDPILSPFLQKRPEELAELLFHELAHQIVYVSGDTDFNEAFATAVAREGLRRWLTSEGSENDWRRCQEIWAREHAFVRLVLACKRELEDLYMKQPRSTPEEERRLRELKQEALDQLRVRYEVLRRPWHTGVHFDGWFREPVNNARINMMDTYYHWVPAFEALLRECHGSLPAFYQQVRRLGRLSSAKRHHALRVLAPRSSEE